jgi:alpha-tubulin suppressor-like RCC1 family protein
MKLESITILNYFKIKPKSVLKYPPDKPIVQVACGYHHMLFLCEDGKVYVMGKNTYGQLGLGHKNSTDKPVYLQSIQGIPVMQVIVGAFHSIVLTISGSIFAFGRNE